MVTERITCRTMATTQIIISERKMLISRMLSLTLAIVWGIVSSGLAGAQSAEYVAALKEEVVKGLAERNVREQFDRYQSYAIGRMDASAEDKQWSDKTGNCRLNWVDHLVRNQLEATGEAEKFTRQLHLAIKGNDMVGALEMMAVKADAEMLPKEEHGREEYGTDSIKVIKEVLSDVRARYDAALEHLSGKQIRQLRKNLYEVTTSYEKNAGSRWAKAAEARELCDIMELIDRRELFAAAEVVLRLTDQEFVESLTALQMPRKVSMRGTRGDILGWLKTADGTILLGGPGDNVYELDKLPTVAMVIDTGGDDIYLEGATTMKRPVLIILDLGGNDLYRGQKPGLQGGAIMGISALLDLGGDDIYDAKDIAQGSCVAGVGMLIDYAGNDSYRGLRKAQGQAVAGVGILLDRQGNDSYHAALHSQGVGGPLGIGLLDDLDGQDHYYAGGLYLNGYGDTPGYAGWSQGVGAGPRGVANGGIGVLLDGGGDDLYECDYFSHGGGYWFSAGMARDFGGNDRRVGSTRLAYDGSPRAEKIFLRWGIAFGCHYGPGFVFDDAGDDVYGGSIVGQAFAWDIAVTALCDFGGNDRFEKISSGPGTAREAGLALLLNVGGDDVYEGTENGWANPDVQYHPLPDSGGNFAFGVDYLGRDSYAGSEENNNKTLERGSPTGFQIDRDELLEWSE